MCTLKRLVNLRGMVVLGGLLMVIYIGQVVFAQDATTTEPDPAQSSIIIEETAVPTAVDAAPTDQAPVHEPTATDVPVELTTVPTETDQAPVDLPTALPTSQLPLPVVNLLTDSSPIALNATVSVTVQAANLSSVYGAALLCLVDPTHMVGLQAETGSLFTPEQLTILDNGFQPDGQWAMIGSQGEKAPAMQPAGTLWTLTYQVISEGATQMTCQIQLADRAGQPLPMSTNVLTLTVVGYAQTTAPDSVASATPVVDTSVPQPVVPTAVPAIIVTAAPTPIPTYHLQGYVTSPYTLPDVRVTLSSAALQQSMPLQSDSSFGFDVPSGAYQLTITAPYHLPYVTTVTMAGQPILLPLITLQNGDIDSNGVINGNDIAVVIQQFGMTTNTAADLNGDGVINIYDLAIVSSGINK